MCAGNNSTSCVHMHIFCVVFQHQIYKNPEFNYFFLINLLNLFIYVSNCTEETLRTNGRRLRHTGAWTLLQLNQTGGIFPIKEQKAVVG